MRTTRSSWFHFVILVLTVISGGIAKAATSPHYLITNDDTGNFSSNSLTFYTIQPDGSIALTQQVFTAGTGIFGGFFPMNRLAVLNATNNQCVFATDASSNDIAAVNINTLALIGTFTGSSGDSGTANGIGLAMNSQYLYASYSSSNTIATFQIQPSCALSFVSDVTVAGLQQGFIDGMAVHGNIMVTTYGDGSIESFNLSNGVPVSNGDEQNSTGSAGFSSYPSGIDITQDGHFAIFGDTSTATLIEVSDISSGKLTTTKAYKAPASISSSNIMLSPDETLLYIVNTQGAQVTAAFFNATTGVPSKGCISNLLAGESSAWSYLATPAFPNTTGNGGGIYVAEFGAPSSISAIAVSSSGGTCSLQEAKGSPVPDPNSQGLLSIATFPPRAF